MHKQSHIAMVAGQYKIHCPALAFDLPIQSGTYQLVNLRRLLFQNLSKAINVNVNVMTEAIFIKRYLTYCFVITAIAICLNYIAYKMSII